MGYAIADAMIGLVVSLIIMVAYMVLDLISDTGLGNVVTV